MDGRCQDRQIHINHRSLQSTTSSPLTFTCQWKPAVATFSPSNPPQVTLTVLGFHLPVTASSATSRLTAWELLVFYPRFPTCELPRSYEAARSIELH
eukprot:3506136-Amphidinium_carterae.1